MSWTLYSVQVDLHQKVPELNLLKDVDKLNRIYRPPCTDTRQVDACLKHLIRVQRKFPTLPSLSCSI